MRSEASEAGAKKAPGVLRNLAARALLTIPSCFGVSPLPLRACCDSPSRRPIWKFSRPSWICRPSTDGPDSPETLSSPDPNTFFINTRCRLGHPNYRISWRLLAARPRPEPIFASTFELKGAADSRPFAPETRPPLVEAAGARALQAGENRANFKGREGLPLPDFAAKDFALAHKKAGPSPRILAPARIQNARVLSVPPSTLVGRGPFAALVAHGLLDR